MTQLPQQDSRDTHCKVSMRYQKPAQAFNKLAESLATAQLSGERKREMEGKCHGHASRHSLPTAPALRASSKHCLTYHRNLHVLQPFISCRHAFGLLSNSL